MGEMTWGQSDFKAREPPAQQPTVLILKYSFQKYACFSTHFGFINQYLIPIK